MKSPTRRHGGIVRPGFTLIEMLVVMGIILLLIAILLPALNRAYRDSVRNSMSADLMVISQALDAYRGDFGDYPRAATANPVTGAVILCWGLIAPGQATQDGADGPGFRLRATSQGKIYGPYLPPERFQLGTVSGITVTPVTSGIYGAGDTVIADRYGNVILYFPASLSISPRTSYLNTGTIGATPPKSTYNYSDNSTYLSGTNLTLKVMRFKLGDTGTGAGYSAAPFPTPDGKISGTESAAASTPYILWSAGPDGKFGPQTDATTGLVTSTDDDVTYPVLNDVPQLYHP